MEFKKLSDVEVVETVSDVANVLIEENGVIKKAPKTAVGGSGGNVEPDMVITISGSIHVGSTSSQMSVTDGSVSAINAKLQASECPIVKVRHISGTYGDYYCMCNEFYASVTTYGEDYWFSCIVCSPSGPSYYKVNFGMDTDHNFTWSSFISIL